jgi:hypothetical protein
MATYKKILTVLISAILLCSSVSLVSASASDNNLQWEKAYSTALNEYYALYQYANKYGAEALDSISHYYGDGSDLGYGFLDINDDKIPELFILQKVGLDDQSQRVVAMYTLLDGILSQVYHGAYFSHYLTVDKSGYVVDFSYSGTSYEESCIQKLDPVKGALITIKTIDKNYTAEGQYTLKEGDVETIISEQEYKRLDETEFASSSEEDKIAFSYFYDYDPYAAYDYAPYGTDKNYIDAYISVLREWRPSILEHPSTDNKGAVAIMDICGDSTPELLFATLNVSGYLYEYSISIYAYEDGMAKRIFISDAMDHYDDSWIVYAAFLSADGDLYICTGDGGASMRHYNFNIDKFSAQNGDFSKSSVLSGALTLDMDSGQIESYDFTLEGRKISLNEYRDYANGFSGDMKTLLFANGRFDYLDEHIDFPLWGPLLKVTSDNMGCDQAVAYLDSLRAGSASDATPAGGGAPGAGAGASVASSATTAAVLVNGEALSFDAYNIGGNNYFKLRDLAYALNGSEKQFSVSYDGASQSIRLGSGQEYIPVGGEMGGAGAGDKTPSPTSQRIFKDGAEISPTAYNIGGNNYFKLRDIGEAFDFEVDWDGARNTIVIDTGKGYTPD